MEFIKTFKWPILWAFLIFGLSSTVISSKSFVQSVSTVAAGRVTESSFDAFWRAWWWLFVKGYHFLEFAVLAVLLARALKPRSAAIAFFISVVYAGTDEFHQSFVPGRGGMVSDVLIDATGAGFGLILWNLWAKRREESDK